MLLSACGSTRPNALAEVYAGPATLPVRAELNPKSKVTGTVKHGDKLYVLERWRRLYHVRSASGVDGWTHERNLMNADQMRSLQALEARARRLPSQGVGTTFEALNVHTEARRYSPAFIQIGANQKFDVLAHQLAPRTEPERRVLIKPAPKTQPRSKRASKKTPSIAPPPPPKLPDNWEELSRERSSKDEAEPEEEEKLVEPVAMDDWSLIRTSGGSSGWVLTNRVYMAIPEEVAQYAEGKRIVSYFEVGRIHDDELDEDKKFWLWSTVSSGRHPYDFDGFRVFTWNPRRHRYETAYIQRRIEGYLPMLVAKRDGQTTFSVCLAQEDGTLLRRSFVMVDRMVRPAGDVGACKPAEEAPPDQLTSVPATPESQDRSMMDKLKEKAGNLKEKVLRR